MQMGSSDGAVEIDILERPLLPDRVSHEDTEAGDGTILFRASFLEMEENFVKYKTAEWILYSLLLIIAWGIGLIMLLYLPVRRYIVRKDFQSRKLYVTPISIVYKVTKPVFFPCFGVLKKEKHVLLPAVADVVVEQGYLQSFFGIYSVRIENAGVRRPPSDDVQIQGIAHAMDFRKAILVHLSNLRNESFARQVSTNEEPSNLGSGLPPLAWLRQNTMSPSRSLRLDSFNQSGELVLQKVEEIRSSVRRVQRLMEERRCKRRLTFEPDILRETRAD